VPGVRFIHKTLLQHRPIASSPSSSKYNLYQITRSPLKWQQSFLYILLPAAPDLICAVLKLVLAVALFIIRAPAKATHLKLLLFFFLI